MYEEQYSTDRSSRYDIQERIGEGAFGEVRLGIDTQVGVKVAMKYVRLGGKGGEVSIPRAVFREMEALKQVFYLMNK